MLTAKELYILKIVQLIYILYPAMLRGLSYMNINRTLHQQIHLTMQNLKLGLTGTQEIYCCITQFQEMKVNLMMNMNDCLRYSDCPKI